MILHCLDVQQFIYPFTHLGYLEVLTMMNKAAINIRVQIFVWA